MAVLSLLGCANLPSQDRPLASALDCTTAFRVDVDGAGASGPVARPSGTGTVDQYGGTDPVYGESPEVVWEIHLSDSAQVSLWVGHEEESDIDLFLLEQCDPMAVLQGATNGTTSEHINWLPLPPGKFYLVADAKNGKFFDAALSLSYDRRLRIQRSAGDLSQ